MIDQNTAQLLRLWRERAALSQEEAADRLGLDFSQWSRWETGRRAVPAARVLAVEALTGISRHVLRADVFGPNKEESL